MPNVKENAIALRKEGKSYAEIAAALGVPKGTLSGWFRGEAWSAEIRDRKTEEVHKGVRGRMEALNAARGTRLKEGYERAREEAAREFVRLKKDPVFVAGVALHLADGDRSARYQVRLGSSDPELLAAFVRFLTGPSGVPPEKVRAHLIVYPQTDEVSARRFWGFATGVPFERFMKTTVLKGREGRGPRFGNGICTIIVSSAYLKEKMGVWGKLLLTELMQKR